MNDRILACDAASRLVVELPCPDTDEGWDWRFRIHNRICEAWIKALEEAR